MRLAREAPLIISDLTPNSSSETESSPLWTVAWQYLLCFNWGKVAVMYSITLLTYAPLWKQHWRISNTDMCQKRKRLVAFSRQNITQFYRREKLHLLKLRYLQYLSNTQLFTVQIFLRPVFLKWHFCFSSDAQSHGNIFNWTMKSQIPTSPLSRENLSHKIFFLSSTLGGVIKKYYMLHVFAW